MIFDNPNDDTYFREIMSSLRSISEKKLYLHREQQRYQCAKRYTRKESCTQGRIFELRPLDPPPPPPTICNNRFPRFRWEIPPSGCPLSDISIFAKFSVKYTMQGVAYCAHINNHTSGRCIQGVQRLHRHATVNLVKYSAIWHYLYEVTGMCKESQASN